MLYNVLRDAAFNSDQPEQYHLSVQLSLDGVLYALLHKSTQTYHYISAFKQTSGIASLEELVENDELLKKKWNTVSVMFTSKNYLVVPLSALQAGNSVEAIYRFQFATSIAHKIVSQSIPGSQIAIVYSQTNELSTFISTYFGKAKISHHAVSYIQSLLKFQNTATNESNIHVQFQKNFIDIAIIKNKQLQFCNSFHIQTPEDAIYYIMNAYQHSGNKADINALKISGMIAEKSDTRRLVDKYFPMAQFDKIDARSNYRFPFDTTEVHSVINLLNLYPCEL